MEAPQLRLSVSEETPLLIIEKGLSDNPLLPMPCGGEGSRYLFIQNPDYPIRLSDLDFVNGLFLKFRLSLKFGIDIIFWTTFQIL